MLLTISRNIPTSHTPVDMAFFSLHLTLYLNIFILSNYSSLNFSFYGIFFFILIYSISLSYHSIFLPSPLSKPLSFFLFFIFTLSSPLSVSLISLVGQCHEIFQSWFFHLIAPQGTIIGTLGQFPRGPRRLFHLHTESALASKCGGAPQHIPARPSLYIGGIVFGGPLDRASRRRGGVRAFAVHRLGTPPPIDGQKVMAVKSNALKVTH